MTLLVRISHACRKDDIYVPVLAVNLLELLLQDGSQVLGNLEGIDSNLNSGNSFRRKSINSVLGDTFLDSNVVRVLSEEVRHGSWVLSLQLFDHGLVFLIGHVVTEDFLAGGIRDSGERVGSSATISLDRDSVSVLGLDGELDLVKVGKVSARGSLQGLHGREFLIGSDFGNIVNGNVVERSQKSKFVNGHVLEHTFGVTFKALSKRFSSWFVGIVGDKGNVGSFDSFGKFASLANVLADILVVSHQDFDSSGVSLVLHLFQLGDSGGTWLFQVDALGTLFDALGQQAWIVSCSSRDEG
mmetsp:Transcript_16535/g.40416  ORF Transcript_16535/g.40416 Transcript_16535/m.40416 type:complete len:299 (+) Transcript_16535:141-1037(+)